MEQVTSNKQPVTSNKQQVTGNKSQGSTYQPGFQKLLAWQRAHELALEVYRLCRRISRNDRACADQLRRAGLSVPTNIAEGSGPATAQEFIRYLEISGRSLNEVEYLLMFAEDAEILPRESLARARHLREETGRLVFRLTESLRKKASSGTWSRGMIREESGIYYTMDGE